VIRCAGVASPSNMRFWSERDRPPIKKRCVSKMRRLLRFRSWIKPEVRDGLDGLGLFFAITLFFCLIDSAHGVIAVLAIIWNVLGGR
jgi:hypothetical protein